MTEWDEHVSFVEYVAVRTKVNDYAASQLMDGNELDPELEGDDSA